MIRRLITIGLAIAAVVHFIAVGQGAGAVEPAVISAASPSGDADSEGVLLLRGGGVLEGTITRDGDRYRVTRANGRFDVAAERVTLVCHSLEEAYERQRQHLPRDSAEAHLALAEWCLRYDLAPQAARELTDVRRLDPRHPKLRLVERRLDAANQSAVVRGSPDPARRPWPGRETGHNVSAASPTEASEPTTRDHQPAADEMRQLEAAVADLPAGVVERFARRVQPLLVNNCTTAGCHLPSGPLEFQLDRAVLHGLSNRRTTLRNLTATLKLIDRSQPHVSPLLVVPRQTHGGMRKPVFGPRQAEQLRQLVDWIALVSDSGADEATVAAAGDTVTKLPPNKFAVRPASIEIEAPTLRPKQPLRYGAEIAPWQPKDPFDPEIFDRRVRAAAERNAEADSPVDDWPTER